MVLTDTIVLEVEEHSLTQAHVQTSIDCRYMTAMDPTEFAQLLARLMPKLQREFPRTPEDAPDSISHNYKKLTLRAIVYLTLVRARHGITARASEVITGFKFTHINKRLYQCEKIIIAELSPQFECPPSDEELVDTAKRFEQDRLLGNIRIKYV